MIKLCKYTVKDSVHYTENCSVISLKTEMLISMLEVLSKAERPK